MKRILKTGIALAALAALPAQANPFETMLPNGMRVIVKEDRRAPSVVHMVWYKVGAIDEVDGTSGVAHVLEHMMFKGTKNLKPGEFNQRVARAGGRDNAFTSHDYTAYFQQVPKRALPEMMKLESDRMENLIVSDEEFAKEIKVVMEERRLRTEDRPQALVYEALMSAAFQAHPYRRPIVGWMNDLENMTGSDARDWYHRWYAPNNATLVVVGDVAHEEVFKLAADTYGRDKKRESLPVRKPQVEPEQTGIKRVNVKAPAELPYMLMAWKAPKLVDIEKDRDPYALEILAGVLDGHAASRFARNLVRGSQIAQQAGAGYDGTLRGEATFLLDGTPAPGKTLPELEQALRAEIARVQKEGVSQQELERVKVQVVAAQTYKRDSLFAQAMEIGQSEVIGLGWRSIDREIEQLRSVTPAEVQAVATRYLKDDTLTIATLDPQPVTDKKPRAAPAGMRHTN
ncbi:MAG: insulinase family protein [Sterolibacteriaceae bacterium]|nr:insulinase family protein [Candidatus Methylophosphatis haderslevensis]